MATIYTALVSESGISFLFCTGILFTILEIAFSHFNFVSLLGFPISLCFCHFTWPIIFSFSFLSTLISQFYYVHLLAFIFTRVWEILLIFCFFVLSHFSFQSFLSIFVIPWDSINFLHIINCRTCMLLKINLPSDL